MWISRWEWDDLRDKVVDLMHGKHKYASNAHDGPFIKVGETDAVPLAAVVDAILEHFDLEIVAAPARVVRVKKAAPKK